MNTFKHTTASFLFLITIMLPLALKAGIHDDMESKECYEDIQLIGWHMNLDYDEMEKDLPVHIELYFIDSVNFKFQFKLDIDEHPRFVQDYIDTSDNYNIKYSFEDNIIKLSNGSEFNLSCPPLHRYEQSTLYNINTNPEFLEFTEFPIEHIASTIVVTSYDGKERLFSKKVSGKPIKHNFFNFSRKLKCKFLQYGYEYNGIKNDKSIAELLDKSEVEIKKQNYGIDTRATFNAVVNPKKDEEQIEFNVEANKEATEFTFNVVLSHRTLSYYHVGNIKFALSNGDTVHLKQKYDPSKQENKYKIFKPEVIKLSSNHDIFKLAKYKITGISFDIYEALKTKKLVKGNYLYNLQLIASRDLIFTKTLKDRMSLYDFKYNFSKFIARLEFLSKK